MSADDKAPPSATKLKKLRDQGNLPTSSFAVQSIGVAMLAWLLSLSGPALLSRWSTLLQASLTHEQALESRLAIESLLFFALALLSISGCISWLVQLLQSGGYARLPRFSFARLKPFASYKSRFAAEARWTMLSQIIGLTAPMYVAGRLALQLRTNFTIAWHSDHTFDIKIRWLLQQLTPDLRRFWGVLALSLAAASLFDLLMRRRGFFRKHGMDVAEQKQEYKNQEGGPEKRQAQAEMRFEILLGPPVKAMRAADVIVRNPTHIAVAIAGAFTSDPWIVMVGRGRAAHRVLRLARRYQRPQVRSVMLARALAKAGEGADVPANLIAAVAEAAYWAHGLERTSSANDHTTPALDSSAAEPALRDS